MLRSGEPAEFLSTGTEAVIWLDLMGCRATGRVGIRILPLRLFSRWPSPGNAPQHRGILATLHQGLSRGHGCVHCAVELGGLCPGNEHHALSLTGSQLKLHALKLLLKIRHLSVCPVRRGLELDHQLMQIITGW